MTRDKCECADPGCGCRGACQEPAVKTLFRSDMVDITGTRFCDHCADDAFAAGVFYDEDDRCDLEDRS